jgi:mycothiol system anti-sigma-R factor
VNCRELESFLYPYLDGEFGTDEKSELEKHLAECPACAQKVHVEARFKQAVRKAGQAAEPAAPAALRKNILAGLDREARRPAFSRMAVGAAAAVFVVTLGGAVVFKVHSSHRQSYLDAATLNHSKSLPLEISAVPHEHVEAWFGGKLDHRVAVPRLHNVKLTGARLINVQDKPAAYISYDASQNPGDAPRRVGLFVFDDARNDVDAQPLHAVEVSSSRGYNVAMWKDGEIVYELVSDLDERDIRQMLVGGQAAPLAPPMVQPVSLQH